VKVAIVGKPNTGKSSLLNNLLNYEKAIVSAIPGTTRDVVEGSIEINGVKFNLYDTAGIRETDDYVENQGILRSEKLINSADIILYVYDLTSEIVKMQTKDKPYINVYNKSDIANSSITDGIIISAKTGNNIDKLKQTLYNLAFKGGIDYNAELITEQRHYNALVNAKQSLQKALEVVDVLSLDLISEDIKEGWQYLGEITGKTASEEIIDEIFSKFCVGK
ncbi:MAG: 50S ribosome-binding GTPase, partial [Clostridia bacterium]|nr:50S ribosome-binding GTPase [Clostridia bacterium]